MKIGIVGLPNVGKSTLFNALTKNYAADAANFPFCTIDPNVGIVEVKDPRVDKLAELSDSQKKIYAAVDFVDIAGLVKGASQGEWLGNQFLSNIRETDAIVQVVRAFEDDDVVHVEGAPDPERDVEIINTELILADLQMLEKLLDWLTRKLKSHDLEVEKLHTLLLRVKNYLEQGKLAYDIADELSDSEKDSLRPYNFLTFKPFVYAINVSEEQLKEAQQLQADYQDRLGKPVAIVSAKFEEELLEMGPDERAEFVEDIAEGVEVPTLDDLIKLAFDTVGLMYYFTTGEKETRAWTVPKGSTAPQAAGAIHTDFERWFIKAELVTYPDFVSAWGRSGAREQGKMRMEGKEYIVQDGDVILFKFNV